ncbi:MAG: MBL fold metallo-hydrolase [Planctomycetota bacterium]
MDDCYKIPPKPNEFELSLFGPGKGECVVLHLGTGTWFVIDSYVDRNSGRPIAEKYLNDIGVDPNQISGLLVSHWHDDHVGGASMLARRAAKASVFVPVSLNDAETLRMLAADKKYEFRATSRIGEFRQLCECAKDRLRHVVVDRTVCETEMCTMRALSPSDEEVTKSLERLAKQLPPPGSPLLPFRGGNPNDASIVLLVNAGLLHLVLGSDLLQVNSAAAGWNAVVSNPAMKDVMAAITKVPHHGSKSSYSQVYWSKHSTPDGFAAIAPYRGGNVVLPRKADTKRLASLGKRVLVTQIPDGKVPRRRNAGAEKELEAICRNRRVLIGENGQIRFRWTRNARSVAVELFAGAYEAT